MHINHVHEFTAPQTGTDPVQQNVSFSAENIRASRTCDRERSCRSAICVNTPVMLDEILLRATRLNTDLRFYGVDTVHEDTLVLAAGSRSDGMGDCSWGKVSSGCDPENARLGKTLSHLRSGYRRILIREDLPPVIAKEVLDVAQLLDKAAGNMGYY